MPLITTSIQAIYYTGTPHSTSITASLAIFFVFLPKRNAAFLIAMNADIARESPMRLWLLRRKRDGRHSSYTKLS
jgi:hypothetical protein